MEIDFALLRENAGAAVPVLISHIAPDTERDRLVEEVRELCRCFVNIAAATLLLEGRSQPFFLNLCRAAENWRRLLVHLEQRQQPPPPASWGLTPLAGVVAAGHWELATRVAERLSAHRRKEEGEYAVEFAWASALGGLVLHAARGEDPTSRIQELARVSREECWPTLARALVDGDSAAFLPAFADAHALHEARTEKLARGFTQREDRFAAHRYLWFEGLALLRLARKRGLDLPAERHHYCPPLAQAPMTEPYQGDWVARLGQSSVT
ncbi:immunity 49 family protein [Myxococcus sp. RHSTA-1-4]|uniref:immunity 49 family protein n=1 Tax=Myxococcus sp. RHSTA-1-4 TaxID=2874601 RepID=UPI001CBE407E|nr:immunity 49 family protein [Myxococcus sp. RHSTA-1-4]MBZ4417487.1 immunity 49 family protein [Myxococcus sp. RHSTA-1-4]